MKTLLKVLLFVGLKIVEICGIIFIPYWLAIFYEWINFMDLGGYKSVYEAWSLGLTVTFFVLVLAAFVFGLFFLLIPAFIKANIKLVNRIIK